MQGAHRTLGTDFRYPFGPPTDWPALIRLVLEAHIRELIDPGYAINLADAYALHDRNLFDMALKR